MVHVVSCQQDLQLWWQSSGGCATCSPNTGTERCDWSTRLTLRLFNWAFASRLSTGVCIQTAANSQHTLQKGSLCCRPQKAGTYASTARLGHAVLQRPGGQCRGTSNLGVSSQSAKQYTEILNISTLEVTTPQYNNHDLGTDIYVAVTVHLDITTARHKGQIC